MHTRKVRLPIAFESSFRWEEQEEEVEFALSVTKELALSVPVVLQDSTGPENKSHSHLHFAAVYSQSVAIPHSSALLRTLGASTFDFHHLGRQLLHI